MRISDWSSDVCASDLRRVKRPKGFINCIEVLHKPDFRLPLDIEKQTIGADRFPLWAGPEGWQTACHNPSVIAAMLTGEPYPVRALYVSDRKSTRLNSSH